MNRQILPLDKIKTDGGTQARAALNEDVVAEYADAITAGADLPPVVVFQDGKRYWLADGFHRFHAHRKARAESIDADVRVGTKRDAILHSVGANASHGLRRTNADKRSAVATLLADKEWATWSDRQIADACCVSHPLVASIRSGLSGNSSSEKIERRYVTKHGTDSTMDVTAQVNRHEGAAVVPVADTGAGPAASATRRVESDSTSEAAAQAQSQSSSVSCGDHQDISVTSASGAPTHPQATSAPSTDEEGDSHADQRPEVEELRQQVVELTDILTGFDAASEGEKAAAAEITRLATQLRVVESQRDQYMLTCTEIKRQVKALQRENVRLLALVPQEAA